MNVHQDAIAYARGVKLRQTAGGWNIYLDLMIVRQKPGKRMVGGACTDIDGPGRIWSIGPPVHLQSPEDVIEYVRQFYEYVDGSAIQFTPPE